MKKAILVTLLLLSSVFSYGKVKKSDVSKELLDKAIAENGIFRCSFMQTTKSKLKGKALKSSIRKNCKNEISKINKWYKAKGSKERSDLLISNGIRSATSHKKTL